MDWSLLITVLFGSGIGSGVVTAVLNSHLNRQLDKEKSLHSKREFIFEQQVEAFKRLNELHLEFYSMMEGFDDTVPLDKESQRWQAFYEKLRTFVLTDAAIFPTPISRRLENSLVLIGKRTTVPEEGIDFHLAGVYPGAVALRSCQKVMKHYLLHPETDDEAVEGWIQELTVEDLDTISSIGHISLEEE